ncbi:MAG: GNAT family N-acetyltransferase [Ktedonobacteraceae bacterium]|nr:GNAT family N-acetyltransferase [Ktedonobacteraceae bacterium]
MIIRLRNLAVRAPVMADVAAVTHLMNICDEKDGGVAEETAQHLRDAWNSPDFQLAQDAWVVTTSTGDTVGYGVIRHDEEQQLTFNLYVRPDHRERGIGTLLLWLLEERARQLVNCDCYTQPDESIVLRTTIVHTCEVARHLFEREGYSETRTFWRLAVEMEPDSETMRDGKLMVELELDARNLTTTTRRRTGMYTARQYIVYEKVIWPGRILNATEHEELCLPASTH